MTEQKNKLFSMDPRIHKGIEYFNKGMFFDAHEELEFAWRDEHEPVRELYRGILQIAVAFYHIQNGNLNGAKKMFLRAKKWLIPFNGQPLGINIDQLKKDAAKIEEMVIRNRFKSNQPNDEFIFPKVEYKKPKRS